MEKSFMEPISLSVRQEAWLQDVDTVLQQDQVVVVSGPEGVGKTGIMIEFARRFAQKYERIIWICASSYETLLADCLEVAQRFDLAVGAQVQLSYVIEVLRVWLKDQKDYLLVLDNVTDPDLVKELYTRPSSGHVVLTTCLPVVQGIDKLKNLDALEQEEATFLLLRLAGLIGPDVLLDQVGREMYKDASQLAQELRGLPKALELAALYIKETECNLPSYLHMYRMLKQPLSETLEDIDKQVLPIIITARLSWLHIIKTYSSVSDFFYTCALLASEDIPEAIFIHDTFMLGVFPQEMKVRILMLERIIEKLEGYGLVQPQIPGKGLSVPTSVQIAIRIDLSVERRKRYVEQVLRTIILLSPLSANDFVQSLRLLVHIKAILDVSETWKWSPVEAIENFSWAAEIQVGQQRYDEGERLLRRALKIARQCYGNTHSTIATILSSLAHIRKAQGDYDEAERLLVRTNLIRMRVLGEQHPDSIQTLCDLGSVCISQEKKEEAEILYQRALTSCEQVLGLEHPVTILALTQTAELYIAWLAAMTNQSTHLEVVPDTPPLGIAGTFQKLALIYIAQEKLEEAETLYQRVLLMYEEHLGDTHPDTIQCLDQLVFLYTKQEKLEQAEIILKRVLDIRDQTMGREHPDVAVNLNSLAGIYLQQGEYTQAEEAVEQALAICKEPSIAVHPVASLTLSTLATIYEMQEKYEELVVTLDEIIILWEKQLDVDNPQVQAARAQSQEWKALLELK